MHACVCNAIRACLHARIACVHAFTCLHAFACMHAMHAFAMQCVHASMHLDASMHLNACMYLHACMHACKQAQCNACKSFRTLLHAIACMHAARTCTYVLGLIHTHTMCARDSACMRVGARTHKHTCTHGLMWQAALKKSGVGNESEAVVCDDAAWASARMDSPSIERSPKPYLDPKH